MSESFSFGPPQPNIPPRSGFAHETMRPVFHSVRDARRDSEQQRADRQAKEERERRYRDLMRELDQAMAAQEDEDPLADELDRLDQERRYEPMRPRDESRRSYVSLGDEHVDAREQRRFDYRAKTAEITQRYDRLPNTALNRMLRHHEEMELRLKRGREPDVYISPTEERVAQFEARIKAQREARLNGYYPEQKPFDRFEREDKERLRDWDARLVENIIDEGDELDFSGFSAKIGS